MIRQFLLPLFFLTCIFWASAQPFFTKADNSNNPVTQQDAIPVYSPPTQNL